MAEQIDQQLPPQGPPPSQHPFNPSAEPAVSPEDKILMDNVREKILQVQLESCDSCHERWFDLTVINGKCQKCRARNHSGKFQTSNMMNPGLVPGPETLPPLTQIEEMMISPVHALVSLYQIRG
ncbi:hypothetical protein K438DRAFT_1622431, partial [Mycena galopus ATCC 62051]